MRTYEMTNRAQINAFVINRVKIQLISSYIIYIFINWSSFFHVPSLQHALVKLRVHAHHPVSL